MKKTTGTLCINGRFLGRKPTGVDRFAFELLAVVDSLVGAQDAAVAGLSMQLLVPPGTAAAQQFKHLPQVATGRRQGQAWEQWDLPRAVPRDALLLSLCNTAPALASRQVVAIHDAATEAVPQAFSRSFRAWYRLLMPLLGRRSQAVLTVSAFSRAELQRAFGVPSHKLTVLSEGGEHILRTPADPTVLARRGLDARPYVLAVSSMAAHKNFGLVLQALARLPDAPFDVAIAGGSNPKVFGQAGQWQSDRVKWLGYVSDAELRSLYEGAMAFVFPSLYEGFGIPPLEAMHCGCPVLAARAASIPEVCGEAALYFDPHSPDDLAAALTRIAGDAALRQSLRSAGLRQASFFSWEAGAREMLQVCRTAMGAGA
ncbi:MAG: hypothetical protein RIS44_2937 [Pseudomonadota bacterium]|jgi:glycosyltransferase involved in cell wall biosynthesis